MTATATKVFVMEPIRYCVSVSAGCPAGTAVERADGVGPHERAVAHDAGGDRRQAAAALLGREQVVQVAGGGRVDVRHGAGTSASLRGSVLTRSTLGRGSSGVAQTTPAGWDGGPTVAPHRIS